ncbi:glycine oxidase ThiO [Rhodovibrionaceae bacterium A322]
MPNDMTAGLPGQAREGLCAPLPHMPDLSCWQAGEPASFDLAVIGGGINGLAVAWQAASQGMTVGLFEASTLGSGASRAASGMLAAGIETEPGGEDLWELGRFSQDLWPGFVRDLEAAADLPLGYLPSGILQVALTREEVERLRFRHDFQKSLGIELEWLSSRELRRAEPALRPGVAAAVRCARDHQVDSRLLTAALARAAQQAGAKLYQQSPVTRLLCQGGKAVGVEVAGQQVTATQTLLASGAWSGLLAGLPEAVVPPVRPLKGQSLALALDPSQPPLLSHVVWTESIHMVPTHDGRLIVGATVEEQGFDSRNTAGGIYALLEAARRALPGVEELELLESWVGFRPTSRDDAPLLGQSALPGLLLASGHHRNGVLLAPATARLVSQLLLKGEMPPEGRAFSPLRFSVRAA